MTEQSCLHCGQTPSEIKREKTICGIVGGYEYIELEDEWPRHRWADWTDRDLVRFGITPGAFERHRRTPVTTIQWVACVDTVRGHNPAKKDDPEWGIRAGQCFACGHVTTSPATETPERNEQ